jgi:hypothetical protein
MGNSSVMRGEDRTCQTKTEVVSICDDTAAVDAEPVKGWRTLWEIEAPTHN